MLRIHLVWQIFHYLLYNIPANPHGLQEINEYFSKKYEESIESVAAKTEGLLKALISRYGFELRYQTEAINKEVKINKYYNIYPTVESIELTDKCNVRCRHCYGNFGIEKINYILKEKLEKVLTSMADVGVLSVELIGDDKRNVPLTHIDFYHAKYHAKK